jgi:hypothetical protein
MAQSGYTPIQLYYSSTTTNVPLAANLAYGELAINITDGKLFYKDNANAIQVIGWKVRPATAGGTGLTSFAVGDLIYANTTTTLASLADVATGNALISGGVSTAPSWGKIGLTTHVSGTLPTANGGTNLTSFTANGVVYASSTSALTTGTALQFNGTNLGVGAAASSWDSAFSNVIQVNTPGSGGGALAGSSADNFRMFANTYYNAGYKRIAANYASMYEQSSGGHYWYTAGTSTAGSAISFTQAWSIDTSNNLIPAVAAKGINFTANTPAAGMTSQLLNWYEEGTWTPNQGAGLTVIGAFSSTGIYTRIGRQVTVTGRVTGATSINTSGSGIVCTNLPFTVGTNSNSVGVMTNTATNNTNVYVNPGTATMYSSMASGVSGSLYFTVTYSV